MEYISNLNLKGGTLIMKTCFIVCPIGSDDSDTRKRSDKLFKHILEPVCKECGLDAIRVDHLNSSDSITETIINHLKNSELVIADLSEHNPNAFFEMGYRSALNKPMIHLKSKGDSIPFDVSTIRTFDYDLQDLDLVVDLKSKLVKTIEAFDLDSELEDDDTKTEQNNSNSFNSQILQELFKIQDGISSIQDNLSNSKSVDTTTVSVLADKLMHSSTKTPETAMTEMLLDACINTPEKLTNLMNLVNTFNVAK